MLFIPFIRSGLLPIMILSRGLPSTVAQTAPDDPCAKIAGIPFVDPADAIACQKSFPFNETLRQNVLSVVSGVFDFYTFEAFYTNSPPPFEDSKTDIRAQIARINTTTYATDRDFNKDLWDFTTQLNDGHTRWFPLCYNAYQNILPTPIVNLDNGIFIIPDAVELFDNFGSDFADYFTAKNFDWKRLAGAQVLTIGGQSAFDYINEVARTTSGNYLDHGVRVNSVVSSYRMVGADFSRRLGDLAASSFPSKTDLEFSVIPANSTTSETVVVPYVAAFVGYDFTDAPSYWAKNCAPDNYTNGRDVSSGSGNASPSEPRHALATRVDLVHPKTKVTLPGLSLKTVAAAGSDGIIKSFVLPNNKTGVLFVGSFGGRLADFEQFPLDIDAAFQSFKASGVTNLVIDVTNNGGGLVCLGMFLTEYLAGSGAGSPAYQATSRANPLARKIVKAIVERKLDASTGAYPSDNWKFLNGTRMPVAFDYMEPPISYEISGVTDSTSQRFLDICPDIGVAIPTTGFFDLGKIVIVGNGNCASTCAQFTTAMHERHKVKIAVFGGDQSLSIEYKGMAGQQVLEWNDLDREIKTAGLKNDPLAPPDLLVNGNMRLNWRTGYSFLNESLPYAYVSDPPDRRFEYTAQTYNNPMNLWLFTEKEFFGEAAE